MDFLHYFCSLFLKLLCMKRYILLFWACVLSVVGVSAKVDSTLMRDTRDSIRVSLVTCSPGTEVYAVYGHTALRVEVPQRGVDVVINYGLFVFDAPNFVWRFIKGETDYVVGALDYKAFEREYTERGSSVTLQQLNLSHKEKVRLVRLLDDNLRPENREYRYNFLYNNCSTKARDKVEEAVLARYNELDVENGRGVSFRDIIHQYTAGYPWMQFGIDYLLGLEADSPIEPRRQMFAPEYLKNYTSQMQLTDSARVYPYVIAERVVEPLSPQPAVWQFPLSPVQSMILLFLLVAVVCAFEFLIEHRQYWFDVLLFTVHGLMGCVVAFLFFFSTHPTVGSNLHVIYLNPLPLLLLLFLSWRVLRRYTSVLYHVLMLLSVAFIVVALLMEQYVQPAAWILLSALLLRLLHNAWLYPALVSWFGKKRGRSRATRVHVLAVAVLMCAPAALRAEDDAVPKVVVNIVVDQLRTEYLEKYRHLYSDNGFKRLFGEGRVYSNGYYSHVSPDRSSAVATIYSGTTPYYHGIVGNRFMERKSLRVVSAVDDDSYTGVNTFETASPARLLVTSVVDELKLATNGHAYVVSIAPERDMAVLAGGHAPNTAIWLSDDNAMWSTSAYYDGVPAWARPFNRRRGGRFDWQDMAWEPYFPIELYDNSTCNGTIKEFKHTFKSDGSVKRYKTSACINDEVTQLALACISGSLWGQNDVTDMLCVGYYAGNYEHASEWERPIELQDIYSRLDRNIADLINAVDEEVGIENALFVLTSTGYIDPHSPDKRLLSLPTGELKIEQCKALLNIYLGALYGPGNYVEGAYMNEIYLNRDLIDKRQLRLKEILDCSAEFLCQKEGVKNVYTAIDLLTGDADDEVCASYNSGCSGDLIIEVSPGWTLVDERWDTDLYCSRSNVAVPIIYFGAGLEPSFSRAPIAIERIAPTISHLLRINAPNACSARPME